MIKVFYGPTKEFDIMLPKNKRPKSLTWLVSELDSKNKEINVKMPDQKKKVEAKTQVSILVARTNEYAGITESGINNFVGLLKRFDIKDMYFQNPPVSILNQLKSTYDSEEIIVSRHSYKQMEEVQFWTFEDRFDNRILGQEQAKEKISIYLYKMAKSYNQNKPVVIMLYGPSGVGKTETAKFLSEIMGEKLFRKQLSMYQNNSFADYVFGGNHAESSLARDLLERESNVLLFDEFDKANSIFYSAFYQMFDEGRYEDKNYSLDMQNSIIICTSNFLNLRDIKATLGEPIFGRFDAFIEYKPLTEDIVKMILKTKYQNIVDTLDSEDKKIIEGLDVLNNLFQYAKNIKNVREIDRLLREFVFTKILDYKSKLRK